MHVLQEHRLYEYQVGEVDFEIVIEVRITEVAVVVAISVQLDIATGVGNDRAVGLEDAVVLVV